MPSLKRVNLFDPPPDLDQLGIVREVNDPTSLARISAALHVARAVVRFRRVAERRSIPAFLPVLVQIDQNARDVAEIGLLRFRSKQRSSQHR